MREIKYRGKRVDNGEWVYGVPVIGLTSGVFMVWIESETKRGRVELSIRDVVKQAEVIPETIGQYTGLKDRDGVEIYEGDVLRNIDNQLVDKIPFKVVWDEYYVAWFWWSALGEAVTDHFYQSIASDCEVIGNIHENPELMEKE